MGRGRAFSCYARYLINCNCLCISTTAGEIDGICHLSKCFMWPMQGVASYHLKCEPHFVWFDFKGKQHLLFVSYTTFYIVINVRWKLFC